MRPIRWLRRGMVLVSLGAAGGALIVTARHILETPQPLQSVLPGEGRIDRKHGGDIYYNVAGDESADPIVLLHDFYLGASNYEYRHLFPRLAPTWRVYAPDWLGFGMSEHPPLAYTGEFYANMLLGFLRDVVKRPAVVLAHGLRRQYRRPRRRRCPRTLQSAGVGLAGCRRGHRSRSETSAGARPRRAAHITGASSLRVSQHETAPAAAGPPA